VKERAMERARAKERAKVRVWRRARVLHKQHESAFRGRRGYP
jgi:hypothetical protein